MSASVTYMNEWVRSHNRHVRPVRTPRHSDVIRMTLESDAAILARTAGLPDCSRKALVNETRGFMDRHPTTSPDEIRLWIKARIREMRGTPDPPLGVA